LRRPTNVTKGRSLSVTRQALPPDRLELKVWIPPRRYDLAAEILAEALDKGSSDLPQELLADVAAAHGREVGMRARARSGDSGDRLLAPASTP
jgi:hypothetical protein